MKRTLITIFILAGCILVPQSHAAEEAQFPQPSGFVNDYADILSQRTELDIEGLLREVERKTSAEIVIATINTTAPLTIEQYAVQLFQRWGIGKKGADNGILMIVATGDRKIRIEVGYGLEGAVTDLESKLIIEERITPAFKKGDYDLGISAGVVKLAELIGAEYGTDINLNAKMTEARNYNRKASPAATLFKLLFFILIFGFRFGSVFFLMGSRGSYWSGGSGGSFGGGFGGFGGGFSGGGGASGGW